MINTGEVAGLIKAMGCKCEGGEGSAVIEDGSITKQKLSSSLQETIDDVSNVKSEISQKQDAPSATGTAGQALVLDENLDPVWGDVSIDPEDIAEAVDDWLDEHPEATTTVEDGSITKAKLDSNLQSDIENAYSHAFSTVVDGWTDEAVTYETGYIGSNGAVTSNPSFIHSNYIECSEGDEIYYNLYGYSSTVYIVTFYNSSKTRISGIVGKTGFTEGTTNAPENAAYVVFCSSSASGYTGSFKQSKNQRVSGDTMVTNLKGYTDGRTSIDNTSFVLTRSNLKLISGSIYCNQPTGFWTLAEGMRTDYIPVSEGDVVKYRCYAYIGSSIQTYTLAMFDATKTCVDYVKATATGVINGSYTVASGVAYVMLSWSESMNLYNGWFEITLASYPQSLEDYIKGKYLTEESPLNGKQWCCLGDSITYGVSTTKTYATFIQERTGCVQWNFGESNTAIAKANSSVTNNMATRYSDMYNDADYVTVLGGTNDHGQQISIGQWGDSDQLTLYGAMKILCEGLIGKYVGKKIGFILPMPKYTQTGGVYTDYSYPSESFKPYVDCIHDVCKRYSIPVLDLYTESGLSVANSSVRTALIPDGLHPNADGHKFISRKIQRFLESL